MGTDSTSPSLHISFKQLFYVIASILGVLALMILGKTVLVPLAFAILIAFILYPACVWLEKRALSDYGLKFG